MEKEEVRGPNLVRQRAPEATAHPCGVDEVVVNLPGKFIR